MEENRKDIKISENGIFTVPKPKMERIAMIDIIKLIDEKKDGFSKSQKKIR